MRFHTSDSHFWHRNIIKYCNRPFPSVNAMNEALIHNWNEVVEPEDEVFHYGDVALGPWAEWDDVLSRLNGHITLIVGNHDRIFAGEKEKQRDRFMPIYSQWFDIIVDDINYFPIWDEEAQTNRFVSMSHFPYDGDSHGEERYRDFRLEDKGVPLIHGHTHDPNQRATVSKKGTPMFHVGMDAWDYRPVPETEIVSWLRSL